MTWSLFCDGVIYRLCLVHTHEVRSIGYAASCDGVCCLKIQSSPPHLSLNPEGRLGTTDDFTTNFLRFFLCSPLPSGTWRTPSPSILWCCLPTSSSVCLVFFFLYSALQNGFGQTWWTGNMSIPPQGAIAFWRFCDGVMSRFITPCTAWPFVQLGGDVYTVCCFKVW